MKAGRKRELVRSFLKRILSITMSKIRISRAQKQIYLHFAEAKALFVARFWEQLQKSLGTTVIRSSAYHPQTNGQTERVNQILEDMLRAYVLHYGKNWDKCLSLAEFPYNNSYQSSLKMAPFEALYGRMCRTPLNWSQAGEREKYLDLT